MRAKVGCDGDLVAGVLAADPPAVRELLRRLYTAYCLQRVPGAARQPPLHAQAAAAPTAVPCMLDSPTGIESGAAELGLAAARVPCTSNAEPQAPRLAGVGSGLAAPALAPGVKHAIAEMHAMPWASGLSATNELEEGLAAPRTRKNELELQAGSQGLQPSLPGFDSALENPCTVRDPKATQSEPGLAASTPQLSCSAAWHPPGRENARNLLVHGARLVAEGRSGSVVLASLQGVTGSAAAASEPSSSIAAPGNMLRGAAGGSADAASGRMAWDRTAPEPPGMLACASVAAAQPLRSHRDLDLQLAGRGSPAASRSGTWRAEARAAAPWLRCSPSASFQGSAGVPEPVACDSPRLRSPAGSCGRPSRARRALLPDSAASARADGEAGQASWGDACSIGQCCDTPRANVPRAAPGQLPCTHCAMPANLGGLDCGAAAGFSDEAGLASLADAGQPHCKNPGSTDLAAAAAGCASRARCALFAHSAALQSRPEGCNVRGTGAPGKPGQSVAPGAAPGQDAPCVQGSLEADVPARPATVPCQRYPCGEASLLSPEPAGVLPQAPMPAKRSPHAVHAAPTDAWGGERSGNTGALCTAAEAAHVCKRGSDRSMAHAVVTLRRPLRPLRATSAVCQAATAPGTHSGAASCPERGSACGAAIAACAKVCPLCMSAVIQHH